MSVRLGLSDGSAPCVWSHMSAHSVCTAPALSGVPCPVWCGRTDPASVGHVGYQAAPLPGVDHDGHADRPDSVSERTCGVGSPSSVEGVGHLRVLSMFAPLHGGYLSLAWMVAPHSGHVLVLNLRS